VGTNTIAYQQNAPGASGWNAVLQPTGSIVQLVASTGPNPASGMTATVNWSALLQINVRGAPWIVAISFVAGSFTSNDPGTSGISNTIAFPQAIQKGDLLMVIVVTSATNPTTPPTIAGVKDSIGTRYVVAGSILSAASSVINLSAFLVIGVAPAAANANANTVTATYTSSSSLVRLLSTGSFRGLQGYPQTSTGPWIWGQGTAMTAPTVIGAPNGIVIAFFNVANSVSASGSGSSSPGNDVDGNRYEYQFPSSSGGIIQTATQSPAGEWASLSVAISQPLIRAVGQPRGL
jgi:hypothetical protein